MMTKHERRRIAIKAQQYRQSQRALSTAKKAEQRPGAIYKRLLWPVLLVFFIAALAIGGLIILHTSLNSSASANTNIAPSGNSATGLSGLPQAGTPATPQIRTGVFASGNGGPIPVPANVLKPANSARTVLNNEIYSIYAGALTRQPEIGVLAVLQENEVSGQQNLHLYQEPQHLGSLTILSLQGNIVSFSAANGSQGQFNLLTDQFS